MNLKRVCDGKYLHWPPEIDKKDILWLPPGGILDWDDAFVRRCARGQEYKLEDAPKGSTATPIDHKLFDMARDEFTRAGATQEKAQRPKTELEASIPKPDPRPRRAQERKNDPVHGSVSPSDPR